MRFYKRSLGTRVWKVPVLYGYAHRILEMEYLSDAASLTRALARMSPRQRRRFQAKLTERLLYTIVNHLFRYGELHGDLHPGNIMVASDGELHLIDWGNVVQLEGKWGAVWDYLAAAVLADTQLLTDTLVRMSTNPEESARRRAEIKGMLDDILRRKGVTPLTRKNFPFELARGGMDGLVQRGRTVLHLMANTQQAGVVLNRDYLHVSRSLLAAAGSFGSLYENTSKRLMARDFVVSLARLPIVASYDLVHRRLSAWQQRLRRVLPASLQGEPAPQPVSAPPAPTAAA